ncbi:MAG: hypothetical protein U1A72_08875 [Sulfuritalea sp.]|nr:hypothetical protein [Sulfuritalea sp.]
MGLDSLLTSLNRGVAGVADVQPLRHKVLACNGTESAGVAGVATAMSGADSATAATADKSGDVTRKPRRHKACTPATGATAENVEVRSDAVKVGADGTATALMTADEEVAIRAWLALIEETDPATIAEVIGQCQRDADALDYFMRRASEVMP